MHDPAGVEHDDVPREALDGQLKDDCAWLIKAHQLLRQHGQVTCKNSRPRCDSCPVTQACSYYRTEVKPAKRVDS